MGICNRGPYAGGEAGIVGVGVRDALSGSPGGVMIIVVLVLVAGGDPPPANEVRLDCARDRDVESDSLNDLRVE